MVGAPAMKIDAACARASFPRVEPAHGRELIAASGRRGDALADELLDELKKLLGLGVAPFFI